MPTADLDANDKKIEPGKRTTFCVYLAQSGVYDKSQVVPFGCTLKKLSLFLTSACDWIAIVDVKIDEKIVARVRGKTTKIEYELEEPIYPNSTVNFLMSSPPATSKAIIYGEIETNGVTRTIPSTPSIPVYRAPTPSISRPTVSRPDITHAPPASSVAHPSNGQTNGQTTGGIPFPRYPPTGPISGKRVIPRRIRK